MSKERCEVCGEVKVRFGRGDLAWCRLCSSVLEDLKLETFQWVIAVSRKAAEDAVNAARAKLVGEE